MKSKTFTIWVAVLMVLIVTVTFLGLRQNKQNKETALPQVSAALSRSFDAKAKIKLADLVLVADVNKTAVGACTVEIEEPKHLKGMKFDYNGQDIGVSYKGMRVQLDENSKLASSVAQIIVNAVDKAASGSGIDVSVSGQAVEVSGDCDSGKFFIKLDKKSQSVLSITLPELDFTCNFATA